MMNKSIRKILVPLIIAAAALGYRTFIEPHLPEGAMASVDAEQSRVGIDQLMEAFKTRKSKLWLEVSGVVSKTLRDDTQGDQHQKFVLRLVNGHTVLVAHNFDLAPRVPLSKGDRVNIRGRYEWSKQGGVLHWTHRDPRNHIQGGWIQYEGKKYR
jgi:hypothetical protein